MPVIKANFVRRDTRAKSRAKATVRYIQSRPGKKGEKLTRELFGSDGKMTLNQAFKMIEAAAKGTIFYRFVLSPDPAVEDALRDIDLRNLTTEVMLRLEERRKLKILFTAAEHNDHSPHRHVHIVALLSQKLTQNDLQFLRDAASAVILQQRQLRELALANAEQADKSAHPRASRKSKSKDIRIGGGDGPAPPKPIHACPRCSGPNGLEMQRLTKSLYRCGSCGTIFRDTTMGIQTEREGPGLGLSKCNL